MAKLKPCPFCGKMPKIRYFPPNAGLVMCKPIFKKAHLIAEVGFAPASELTETVVEVWNKAVDRCLK